MEYYIAMGSSVEELTEEVGIRIAEGWRPCGGIAVIPDGELLLQALVRGGEIKTNITVGDMR